MRPREIQRLFKNFFYFDIITDSEEVTKTVQRDPLYPAPNLPQLSLDVMSYITIVQYQIQEIDIGPIPFIRPYWD